jgi:glycosyltransferase involved in cell wall biosynthesis
LKRIIFTVTNDLIYDQRMQRICASLAANGFFVTLIGRKLKSSLEPGHGSFDQKRLSCFFNTGFLFYAEFNLRLFFELLFEQADIFCAIDLDTILSVYLVTLLRNKKRIYDAHELFTEQKEIVTRPMVHKCWLVAEKFAVPKFLYGYTVNQFLADELHRRYKVVYGIIRNLPILTSASLCAVKQDKFIIYQGAVNEGRSFETLIPAMQFVDAYLKIYGKGNYFKETEKLIKKYNLENKIHLMGYIKPGELKQVTPAAYVALNLFEKTGLNQYYSLSNRFFDYIMAGVPQVCVNYPEYKKINDEFNIAIMIDDTSPQIIADAINLLLQNRPLHEQLSRNCVIARESLNWQQEEKKLIKFYNRVISE